MGKPGGPSEEERLTFEDLAADYIQEREVRGATGACLQWSKSRVANLKGFFGSVRAGEVTNRVHSCTGYPLVNDHSAPRGIVVFGRVRITSVGLGARLLARAGLACLTEKRPRYLLQSQTRGSALECHVVVKARRRSAR